MSPSSRTIPAVAAIVIALVGCTQRESEPATGDAPPAPASVKPSETPNLTPGAWRESMMTKLGASCPMTMPDVNVEVEDTAKGAALIFTTDCGDVAELRQRVREMTKNYDAHDGRLGMIWHHVGTAIPDPGRMHAMSERGLLRQAGPMPAVTAVYANIGGGAQITISAQNLSELRQVRAHVRQHRSRMRAGECWTQAMHAAGARDTEWWRRRLDRR